MTKETMEKLQKAANAEELMALAKEESVTLDAAEAQTYFKALHDEKQGELSDEELDNVAGGIWLDFTIKRNKKVKC